MAEALRLDLVGPHNTDAFPKELLPESPSRWYLTGFLVSTDAPIETRSDATAEDDIDGGGRTRPGWTIRARPKNPLLAAAFSRRRWA